MRESVKFTLVGLLMVLISIPIGVFGQWNAELYNGYSYVFTAIARYALLCGIATLCCGVWMVVIDLGRSIWQTFEKAKNYS